MHGADYASSQWFQEGFTEYTANVSTVAAGLMTPAEFRDKLGAHVRGTTPLPLEEVFRDVGLRLSEAPDGIVRVTEDPNASGEGKRTWRRITGGR